MPELRGKMFFRRRQMTIRRRKHHGFPVRITPMLCSTEVGGERAKELVPELIDVPRGFIQRETVTGDGFSLDDRNSNLHTTVLEEAVKVRQGILLLATGRGKVVFSSISMHHGRHGNRDRVTVKISRNNWVK